MRSESLRPHLGEWLTEAIVKEIELKTPYKVTQADRADSELACRIVRDDKYVVTENRNDEPRDIEFAFKIEITWRDRRGDLIAKPYYFDMPPALTTLSQAVHIVPEAGQSVATAHQEAVRRLAAQIVERMEAPW